MKTKGNKKKSNSADSIHLFILQKRKISDKALSKKVKKTYGRKNSFPIPPGLLE